MADYSVSPLTQLLASQQKGYTGLHIEQGVPLLDRDLNLMQDLIAATVQSVIARYIGDGVPAGADGFAIAALPAPGDTPDFLISGGGTGPGRCLVGGIEVTIDAAGLNYSAQKSPVPPLTPVPAGLAGPRTDTVYLDVCLTEVDSSGDSDLANSLDVGIETSVRLMPTWVVRVAEGTPVPPAPAGHTFCPLAVLTRPSGTSAIETAMIADGRQRNLTVSDLERRLKNVEDLRVRPAITSFTPPAGAPGAVGSTTTQVTITGRNFDLEPVAVFFGSVAGTGLLVASPTSLTVNVPQSPPGDVPITIETSGGNMTTSNTFQVLGPNG